LTFYSVIQKIHRWAYSASNLDTKSIAVFLLGFCHVNELLRSDVFPVPLNILSYNLANPTKVCCQWFRQLCHQAFPSHIRILSFSAAHFLTNRTGSWSLLLQVKNYLLAPTEHWLHPNLSLPLHKYTCRWWSVVLLALAESILWNHLIILWPILLTTSFFRLVNRLLLISAVCLQLKSIHLKLSKQAISLTTHVGNIHCRHTFSYFGRFQFSFLGAWK